MKLTMFSFGYFGWGNSTQELVRAVDAVERNRGLRRPIFVDTRLQNSVRAPGFNGSAFRNLIGEKRHRWMKDLGNESIRTDTGRRIKIARPSAVNDLLDLALRAAEENRRIVFFCGCEWARQQGRPYCHRATISALTIRAANRRGITTEIMEWPGGRPHHLELNVAENHLPAIDDTRHYLPMARKLSLVEAASVPWGSTAVLKSPSGEIHAVIGPAKFHRQEWKIPLVKKLVPGPISELKEKAAKARRYYGWDRYNTRD